MRDESRSLQTSKKLEVAELTLQESRDQATEIVFAGWLDDAAKGTPEDPATDRSSEDATQVNAPDHEDEGRATTPITASRITPSMEATTVIEKEQHLSRSVGCRNMTTWNEEHETDKYWKEVKNILMGELVIGIPIFFVSEKPW